MNPTLRCGTAVAFAIALAAGGSGAAVGQLDVVASTGPVPSVALVLGGGAARGAAHIGVIRALIDAGVPIDAIWGTSMGSLIGGLYAAGFDVDTLAEIWSEIDATTAGELLIPPRGGLLDASPLRLVIDALVGGLDLRDTRVPFYPVVIDLETGVPQPVTSGPMGLAIQASTAMPGLFQPVEIDGRWYYDGGLKQTLPASLAREAGATYVIAVDITREVPFDPGHLQATVSRIYLDIVAGFNAPDLEVTDVVLDPGLQGASYMDYDDTASFLAAGERVAREALSAILPDLEARGIPLRPPGDPNRGAAINVGWRERMASGRRAAEMRPRPLNFVPDIALAPAASGGGVTPSPVPPQSRLRLGVDVQGGALGPFRLGASYARSLAGNGDALQVRAGARLAYGVEARARADLSFPHDWSGRLEVVYRPEPSWVLEAALRVPAPALEVAAHHRSTGLWAQAQLHLPLDGGYVRAHLDTRAAVEVARSTWGIVIVRGRAFVGTSAASTPEVERFSVGPATLLRGARHDAYLAHDLFVVNAELAFRTPSRSLAEAARIAGSAWLFVDAARFRVRDVPVPTWRTVPSVGVGIGVDGALFGFLPLDVGIDLAYGPSTGSFHLAARSGPRFPVAWRR